MLDIASLLGAILFCFFLLILNIQIVDLLGRLDISNKGGIWFPVCGFTNRQPRGYRVISVLLACLALLLSVINHRMWSG